MNSGKNGGSRAVLWASALVLLAGLVAFVTVQLGNSETAATPTTPTPTETIDGTDFLPGETTETPLSEIPAKAQEVAGQFIVNAVGRDNLEQAWTLAHPDLIKECGCSKSEWLSGNIPVAVFPADEVQTASFNVNEATTNRIVLGVLIVPKPTSSLQQTAFFIGLKAVGSGSGRKWLVDYFAPDARPAVPQTP